MKFLGVGTINGQDKDISKKGERERCPDVPPDRSEAGFGALVGIDACTDSHVFHSTD